jgi:hypothetical protein
MKGGLNSIKGAIPLKSKSMLSPLRGGRISNENKVLPFALAICSIIFAIRIGHTKK